MKSLPWRLAAGFVLLGTSMAQAQDASQLAQSKGCMSCHAVDQTRMGPSFKAITEKYKGQANAAATIVAELKDGTGHIKVNATDAELQQLATYVLATK